ncbi:RNA polymerase factor sigma-54 [Halodurantibacterium flavum]|uniref:RNA polymerase sigma-54 factor n=1 Tax=Halodurantibacterium flavum TaxID=1382802 RepID=A0ABW4S956_9RHOB
MKLGLRQGQRVTLAPLLRQGIALLRLPALELSELIAREAAENPFLEISMPRPAPGVSAYDVALDTVATEPSLHERLFTQIAMMRLGARVAEAACHLVSELREDGYLDRPLPEIAQETGLPLADLEQGLRALQGCEPSGIGARTLAECLTLQLCDQGLTLDEAQRAVGRIDLFGGQPTQAAAQTLGMTVDRMRQIAQIVPRLKPRPVAGDDAATPPLVADVALDLQPDGSFAARRARGALPALSLNENLIARARTEGFGAEARHRAEALMQALRYREDTLVTIAGWIARHQYRALSDGAEHMLPLTQREIAQALGLSPSTVSRAIAGKGLSVLGRIWPLSRFFSNALPGGDEGLSAFAVQQTIARLIAREPPGAPLSDQDLVGLLSLEGVDISRRTVAKYRGCLRIPSSHGRRRKTRHGTLRQIAQPAGPGGKGPARH